MKRVVFLCRKDSFLGMAASAFASRFGKGSVEAFSASLVPAGKDDFVAQAVMKERGFDLGESSRPAESLRGTAFDLCVHFGGDPREFAPLITAAEWRDWGDITDPSGMQYSEYRRVREEVGRRVMTLLRELRGGG